MQMNGETLLTIPQACDLASVHKRTIYRWLHAGKLRTIRTAGGSVRIYATSLFRPASTPSRPLSAG